MVQDTDKTSEQEAFSDAKRLYESGRFTESASRYRELAEKGYPDAQVFLGWMYSEGVGYAQSREDALYWFKKAAALNSSEGMFYCGRLLEEDEQADEAFKYIRLSAGKNYPPALCRLGLMYLVGRGVAANNDYAMQYLKRAAEQGNVFAKRELAVVQMKSARNPLARIRGGLKFIAAVTESFFIAWRNPYSEKIRC